MVVWVGETGVSTTGGVSSTDFLALIPVSILSVPQQFFHRALPAVGLRGVAPGLAQALGQTAVAAQRVELRGNALGGRLGHEPVLTVPNQLRRTAAVAGRDHRLAGAERLQRHEAVVLVPRR